MDLVNYVKEQGDLSRYPTGMHAVLPADPGLGLVPGVIFALRNRNGSVDIQQLNRLHPYYLVYIDMDGQTVVPYTEVKRLLDVIRASAKPCPEPIREVYQPFNERTQDGREMGTYSNLLTAAIRSIVKTDEEKELDGLFSGQKSSMSTGPTAAIDDFELIAFLVVEPARAEGYTEMIEPLMVERIADLPEYAEQAKRFGIDPNSLKNHVRCVGLSQDRSRCLVTIVDEAWCYDLATNRPLWGLRFPSKEGWTKIASERSGRAGASADVLAALSLMELKLPVSPEAITRQYKALAMRWHPDRNPKDPQATQRFQELGAAMELLTGIDLSRLSGSQIERVVYEQILHQSVVRLPQGINVTISMSMQMSGSFATDWIYAANFADVGNSTFLGGYSGRIVEVSADGVPLRIYDIGTVPRQVARTASHLFILTMTRLYIVRESELVALVDVLDQGKLIIGNRGFGLLQPKHFQWLTHTGQLLGEMKTRDPIRRAYFGEEGLVIGIRSGKGILLQA